MPPLDQHAALGALLYGDKAGALDAITRLRATPGAQEQLAAIAQQLLDLADPGHWCTGCDEYTPPRKRVNPGRLGGGPTPMRCQDCWRTDPATGDPARDRALQLITGGMGRLTAIPRDAR